MAKVERFEDLEIWQLSRKFCIEVEKLVVEGLYSKNRSLSNQLQASSGSIMDNIAEGFEKENTKEFINFLFHSKGSCGEARSQLTRIMDLQYCAPERIQPLMADAVTISKKIKTLIRYLNNSTYKGTRHVSEPKVEYLTTQENTTFYLDLPLNLEH